LDDEVFGSSIGGVMEEEEVENVMLLRNKEVGGVDFAKGLCFTGESREIERLKSTLALLLMVSLFFSFLFCSSNIRKME